MDYNRELSSYEDDIIDNIIDECESDGLEHLIPICLSVGLLPKEAKLLFGRGVWRKLSKLNIRNSSMLLKVKSHLFQDDSEGFVKLIKLIKYCGVDNFIRCIDYYLGSQEIISISECFIKKYDRDIKYIIKNRNINTLVFSVERLAYLSVIVDTYNMAGELNQEFGWNWSYDKTHKMHNKFAKIIRETNDKFPKDVKFQICYEYEGVISKIDSGNIQIKMIDNVGELVAESMKMNHCIANRAYINKSIGGRFLSFHLSNGMEESTLGINVFKGKDFNNSSINQWARFSVSQHVFNSNQPIPSGHQFLEIEEKIMKALKSA